MQLIKNAIKKTWIKYLLLLIAIIIISFGLSLVCWLWFGREIHLGTQLEFDFFTTFCGWVTIISIAIALYQIAELKTRRLIENETTIEVKTTNFNQDALIKCERVKSALQLLKKRILSDSFDESVITSYIDELYSFKDVWEGIYYNQ